uniref:Uncharacterized protein n=1 Tax=Knipowitschia caucasica TaxID=637954 RepID=A0AAV2KM46_KNICA
MQIRVEPVTRCLQTLVTVQWPHVQQQWLQAVRPAEQQQDAAHRPQNTSQRETFHLTCPRLHQVSGQHQDAAGALAQQQEASSLADFVSISYQQIEGST